MLLFWLMPLAVAADCDPATLRANLDAASPVSIPRAYLALAACDKDAARAAAGAAMGRMLAGRDGNEAALAALDVGAHAEVASWMGALQSGERTTTIDFLGKQCADHPSAGDFFAASLQREGTGFWEQRWYRGLADCHTDGVRATLQLALADDYIQERTNRGLYFGILEVYARNLRADSLPTLTLALETNAQDKDASLIVRAFADAANVGQLEGMDVGAAKAAVEALTKLAPQLNPEAIDTVRDTMVALGDTTRSEAMARYRWPERFANGYTYVAAVQEFATCKNGKLLARLHSGEVTEAGTRFPDTLAASLQAKLQEVWGLTLAEKCKGTSEFVVDMTKQPIAGPTDAESFLEAQRKAFEGRLGDDTKVDFITHDPTGL